MEVIGLDACIAAIQRELDAKAQQARTGVKLAGNEYKSDVQRVAPYKTGTYRRSIHVKMEDENGNPYALIGTDLPYARRLEFGFYDMVDSLGRHYYQYPQPHFRPALDLNLNKYKAIMQGTLENGETFEGISGSY